MALEDFVREYFINPIEHPESYAPYNIVNTITFAVLALLAAWLIFKALRKYNVKIDDSFYRAIIPFIIFGSTMRVITDSGLLPRIVEIAGVKIYPFITPGIYILTFLVVVLAMLLSKILAKHDHEEFTEVLEKTGWCIAALTLLVLFSKALSVKNNWHLPEFLLILLLAIVSQALLWLWGNYRKGKHSLKEKISVLGQGFDGAATMVGVSLLGYSEQHVLGNLIFTLPFGTVLFFLIKTAFGIAVVETVREEKGVKEEVKTYILILITIFGLAPGMRDALRLLIGV